ncbi:hypothetical protein [Mycobacterium sp. Marseille-P9652]|uniref:hypothetical protein n=1 Tax=Mycobacterium sp. Marseille-P9652 TaxID=2654950 RepID=UPI0012E93496|nr:hypothetical protein [Mycobacterium sp. Marseille-P9652]
MRGRRNPQPNSSEATGGKPKASARALAQVIERSYRIQGPAAEAYVSRLRNARQGASPAQVIAKLERHYVWMVTLSGMAVGAVATVPGIGTISALSAAAAETVTFLEATAFFALALAVVHGVPADHQERRRALVLAVLVGQNGEGAVADLLGRGRTHGAWLSEGVSAVPLSSMSLLNSRLLKTWVKRYAVRRSALMFGKMLPVGIGVIVGAIGNRLAGKRIVGNARRAFGPAPARWPRSLHLVPPVQEAG